MIGKEFAAESVLALGGRAADNALEGLMRKQLIEPIRRAGPIEDYRFRHLLVRDVVYESMSKSRRGELHERFADWLVEWASSRLGQFEEILGYHLESAYRYRRELLADDDDLAELASRAARHLVAAGRRAARRQDDAGAAALLSRGVALLAEGNAASRLEPLFDLGTALIRRGDTAAAEEVLADARRAVIADGDPRAEVRMRILDLTLKRLVDPEWWAENGRATATQILTRCQELGDELDEAKAWHILGKVHSDRGEQAAAAEALERALEQAERAGDAGVEAWIRYWLLQAAVFGPTPCDKVVARARGDLEWARAHDNRALEGSTLGRMGEMLARSGRVAEAQDAFAEARRIFDDLGLPVHIAYHAASTATSEPLASDPPGAERELRFAVDYFESIGAKAIQATIMPMLATTLVPQGRYDEAIELSERSQEVAGSDDLDANVRWRVVRAEALLGLGEVTAAEGLAREAVDLASASDTVILHANALACLGEVLGGDRDAHRSRAGDRIGHRPLRGQGRCRLRGPRARAPGVGRRGAVGLRRRARAIQARRLRERRARRERRPCARPDRREGAKRGRSRGRSSAPPPRPRPRACTRASADLIRTLLELGDLEGELLPQAVEAPHETGELIAADGRLRPGHLRRLVPDELRLHDLPHRFDVAAIERVVASVEDLPCAHFARAKLVKSWLYTG